MSSKLRGELKNIYKINKSIKYQKSSEIMQSLENNNQKIIKILGKNNIESIPKIAFIREPINRYISLFFYFKNLKKYAKKLNINKNTDINEWTINYFSKNFEKIKLLSKYHFNTQSSFLFYENKLIVDELIKIEEIDYEELKKINIKLSINKVNVSKKEAVNLSEESIKILKEIYKEDFKIFITNNLSLKPSRTF